MLDRRPHDSPDYHTLAQTQQRQKLSEILTCLGTECRKGRGLANAVRLWRKAPRGHSTWERSLSLVLLVR